MNSSRFYSKHPSSNMTKTSYYNNLGFDLFKLNDYYDTNFASLHELLYYIYFHKRYDFLTFLGIMFSKCVSFHKLNNSFVSVNSIRFFLN